MSSQPDEEAAGPSGLDRHEMLQLLGLEMSNSQQEETAANSSDEPLVGNEQMTGSDEDDICQEALDRFERQRAFQTQLLQQSGGGLDTSAKGAFDNYVDRRSTRMGVRERHFNTRLPQRGNLIPDQNITEALQDA